MKKIIFIFFLIILLNNFSSAQFIRIWEKSDALNNLPSWFSPTGTRERGIAVRVINGNLRLYVISNLAEPTVIILDAMTGDSLGTLNNEGIEGGLLFLSDICSLAPYTNKLYACNLTNNATITHFKIYVWETDTSVPQLLVEDSLSTFRIGDHLNFGFEGGNHHYITASSNNNKIVNYYSYDGIPPLYRNEITLSDGNMGSNASADYNYWYPLGFGNYIVNSDGFLPKFFDTLGTMYSMSSFVSSSSNAIKYFANGTLCCDQPFYTTYQFDENNAALVLSIGEPSWETFWGETPSLGNNPNAEHYGDVEYVWLNYYTLYVFVLSGNNGIGAYHAYGLATPVELSSFNAEAENDEVQLSWTTATETNNQGFQIEKMNAVGSFEQVGYVAGFGTTTEAKSYSFIDSKLEAGYYIYRLKQIDFDGTFTYSEEVNVEVEIPLVYSLEQNYPNPFNPNTTIKYSISEDGFVKLAVYNLLGEAVTSLVNNEQKAGRYEVVFDASRFASGVYYYRMEAQNYISIKKMILMK